MAIIPNSQTTESNSDRCPLIKFCLDDEKNRNTKEKMPERLSDCEVVLYFRSNQRVCRTSITVQSAIRTLSLLIYFVEANDFMFKSSITN